MPPEEKNDSDLLERFTKAVEAERKAPMTAMEIKVMISLLREQIAALQAKKLEITASYKKSIATLQATKPGRIAFYKRLIGAYQAERTNKFISAHREEEIDAEITKLQVDEVKTTADVDKMIDVITAAIESNEETVKVNETIKQCETAIQKLLTQ